VIADQNGQPADGETGLGPGYIFAPYIPTVIDPNGFIDPGDFSVLFPPEPSAVDRLAALADQEGEAAGRVRAWEKAEEDRRARRGKWKVYKDPTYERGAPLVRPDFFGTVTVDNL
jgi:hypothetical protein